MTLLPKNDKIAHEQRTFFMKVYLWMGGGLAVSGITSVWVAFTPSMARAILGNKTTFDLLLVVELLLVLILASTIKTKTLSAHALEFLFLAYCFATGLTLSVIFSLYAMSSIISLFFVTAGVFVSMSLYGFFTDHDLTSAGHVLLFGLIGVVLTSVVNLFLRNDALGWIVSLVGVLVFTGLISYDTQKLKVLDAEDTLEGSEQETREAIDGALELYLDFVNLFLQLLRIFGRKR
jgi:hypothetical protein